MAYRSSLIYALGCCLMVIASESAAEEPPLLFSRLDLYVVARVSEFEEIPEGRIKTLKRLAEYVREQTADDGNAALTFICTHNSRRSHLAQIWAATAAAYYGVEGVSTFSGGTESTAFNSRAVGAIRRAGFQVANPKGGENPRYEVAFSESRPKLLCFSKVYDRPPNPTEDFCAVMTCSEADRACPSVPGASERIALPYEDPKIADGTPAQARRYDERCAQIAREMLYTFAHASGAGEGN